MSERDATDHGATDHGATEHDLTAAYAVDALTGEEALRAEQHLSGCAACRAELAEMREVLADLVEPAEPSAGMRQRVLAALDGVEQLPPAGSAEVASGAPPAAHAVGGGATDELAVRRSRRRGRSSRWLPAVAAAAAAVLVAAAALGGWSALRWRGEAEQARLAARAVAEVAAAPDAVSVVADGGPGWASTRVVASASLGEAVLVPTGVEQAPRGRTWQLWWVSGEEAPRPAGLLPGGTGAPEVLEGGADGATAVAVTLEPAGGSAAPTTDPVAVYPLGA
ncbi:anti-sigma factor [Quadrisphaera sp. KR29]|uniref:anti-sigma factor n=1 Tax=Quadrisphaera sp. KR29 TaxID=3461391 RepID=UPI004043CF23